ncbi:response regulator transcription factor [Sphingobium nicotianae]
MIRQREAPHPSIDCLTSREQDVLSGLVCGMTNKEIGRELGISHRTVEIHRARLMRKLGAPTLSALLAIALPQRSRLAPIGSSNDLN